MNVIILGEEDPPDDKVEPEPTDNPQEDSNPLETELQQLQLSKLSSNGFDGPRTLKLFSRMGEFKLLTMIDRGASHCFISEQVACALQLTIDPTSVLTVVLGDGSRACISSICKAVPLTLDSQLFYVTCFVFSLNSVDVILGVSWLATLGDVTANWSKLTMEFQYQGAQFCLRADPSLSRKACATTEITTIESDDQTWMLWVMEGNSSLNQFGTLESVDSQQKHDPELLLSDFPSVTSAPTGLPPQRKSDHCIILKEGTAPVSVRPYRYNHTQKDEMEKLVAEMLDAGIVRPSNSPYSSPVLLVRKKDGSWRFCVDYRALNKVTVPDKYPIPVIQELLDELHGACWFSKLDLSAGYHQIRVAPQDIEKTAFRTHSGHYEFLVMPFGLTNAPATFQSLMNDIFRPFLCKFVLVFFTDILIYSRNWDTHLRHLHQVFQKLHTHSLIINPKKCVLGTTAVEYLGHIVSPKGVQMDPAKVSAVRQWPTPTSPRGLRGFLGLTGYYRRFICNYGKIAAPLTALFRKEDARRWHWTKEADQAFLALKQALTI